MSPSQLLFVIVSLGVIAAVAALARNELRLMRDLKARMEARGFTSDSSRPQLKPLDLRFDGRVGFRGKLAAHDAQVFVGRAFGVRLSDAPRVTSTGQFFYIWAVLRAPVDDAWIARWKGDARAARQDDGSVLVYWQRDYVVANLDQALDELERSLRVPAAEAQ